MLNERRQTQKDTCCMCHLYEISPKKQKANLGWQKIDFCFSRAGNGMGVTGNGHKGSFWGDRNVLKVNHDVHTNPQTSKI